ncbi:ATP synthase F1 subunit delta [uncultured Candidatus Kuenenia sp.]|uniref:ATP synthase F1 subunit delta n=1 Tax=uncultured Candidatus Kuenenia sp. TaxID=1048336 RepID=UPI0002EFAB69|nr:ATP synthase F1 subunit delta [uncultured Candidatus Kuenenia sp.]
MLDKSVAVTFVNALLGVAADKDLLGQVEKDLDLLSDTMARHEDFKKVLLHPSITRKEKKDTIKAVFGEYVSGQMINFLYLLVDRRREVLLDVIPDVYRKVVDKKTGVIRAKIQAAIPIVGERLENLKAGIKKLTGKIVEIEVVENPQILGGLVVEIENKMIDGSVVSRLRNLRSKLMEIRAN